MALLVTPKRRLAMLHAELDGCRKCSQMIGPVVHGPAVLSKVFLIGQAPGPREGGFGRPFAWTAGKTLFGWLESVLGASESVVRERLYMAAVARCFPGKAKGGGDRKPDPGEIERCRTYLEREIAILEPELILPVGGLAIEQVLGHKGPLAEVVGKTATVRYHGVSVDVIALPHPSGASTWHRTEPGKSLLVKALGLLAEHPTVRTTFELSPPKRARRARRTEAIAGGS
jgi:uracil-DNA glycosylase